MRTPSGCTSHVCRSASTSGGKLVTGTHDTGACRVVKLVQWTPAGEEDSLGIRRHGVKSAEAERYATQTAPRPASATSVPWNQNTICLIKS